MESANSGPNIREFMHSSINFQANWVYQRYCVFHHDPNGKVVRREKEISDQRNVAGLSSRFHALCALRNCHWGKFCLPTALISGM